MRYKYKKAVGAFILLCSLFCVFASSVSAFCDTGSCVSVESFTSEDVSLISDVRVSSRFYELLFKRNKLSEQLRLIPGGEVLGIKIKEEFVTVKDAKDSRELKAGDRLLKIDGKEIKSSSDVTDALSDYKSGEVFLEVMRGENKLTLKVTPKAEADGSYRLGVTLKSGACGIGTVTFINPENNSFGALGHGVCDESGALVKSMGGETTGVVLGGVSRGEVGKPGELSGILTRKRCGAIAANTDCGIFGILENYDVSGREAIPVGRKEELKCGEAEIISTVKNGYTARYKIEITDVNTSASGSKCFKIKVTDPTLIAVTGGIVKGMSGSPIIQNDKLVGAVTHVLVANPTEGYGIFIENMLNAAESGATPKAA